MLQRHTVGISVLFALASTVQADSTQFRGAIGECKPQTLGHPVEWSAEKNLAWTVEIPGSGWSSPLVVGERIFVTSAVSSGDVKPKNFADGLRAMSQPTDEASKDAPMKFVVHCLDLKTGAVQWTTVVDEGQPQIPIHPSNSYATETPVADGKHICVLFGVTGALAGLTHDGKIAWQRRLPVHSMANNFGTGSSLALHEGRVFVQSDNEKSSTLSAFDLGTGEPVWTIERDSKTSWSSPLVWRHGRDELVICGSNSVTGYEPATGKQLWRVGGIPVSFSSSPGVDRSAIYFGSSSPMGDSGLYAVKAGASDDITLKDGATSNAGVAWHLDRAGVGMASPLSYEGYVYLPGEGRLRVYEAATGKEVYKQRLPEGRLVVASPWAADGKVFLLDEEGQTFVVKAGPEFEVLGVNKINDTFWSTPAIAGDNLLLRGVNKLYCVRSGSN